MLQISKTDANGYPYGKNHETQNQITRRRCVDPILFVIFLKKLILLNQDYSSYTFIRTKCRMTKFDSNSKNQSDTIKSHPQKINGICYQRYYI